MHATPSRPAERWWINGQRPGMYYLDTLFCVSAMKLRDIHLRAGVALRVVGGKPDSGIKIRFPRLFCS